MVLLVKFMISVIYFTALLLIISPTISAADDYATSVIRDKHIVFIGDSLTRYQYISLLYLLHHRHNLSSSMYPNPVEEKNFASWNQFFSATSGLFAPFQQCDCYRVHKSSHIFENRYYLNPKLRIYMSYLNYFGTSHPIHGHWSPSNYSSSGSDSLSRYIKDLSESVSIYYKTPPPPANWTAPDIKQLLLNHVKELLPKPYMIVMNAGFWPNHFGNHSYAKEIAKTALSVSDRFVWKTTTFTIWDRNKGKREFDHVDELMCSLPHVECLDVSWTRNIDQSLYWDDKHFRAEVYGQINDQLLKKILSAK